MFSIYVRTLLMALLFCTSFTVFAQGDADTITTCDGFSLSDLPFEEGRYYFPVAKHVSILAKPDGRSKVLHKTTSYADTLRLVEVTEHRSVFKKVYGYWCKVSFPLNGKRYFGYVPSQFLAGMVVKENGLVYLVNIDSYQAPSFVFSLKMLRDFKLIYEYKFTPVANYSYFPLERDSINVNYSGDISMTLYTNKGLRDVDRILAVHTGYPACGYWNGTNYLFLRNNAVIYQSQTGHVVDGGEFYRGIDYLFPSDSLALGDTLLRITEHYEVISDTSDFKYEIIEKLWWNGKNPVRVDSVYKINYGKPYITEAAPE